MLAEAKLAEGMPAADKVASDDIAPDLFYVPQTTTLDRILKLLKAKEKDKTLLKVLVEGVGRCEYLDEVPVDLSVIEGDFDCIEPLVGRLGIVASAEASGPPSW